MTKQDGKTNENRLKPATAINPYWPDEMLSMQPLSAPIIGKWGLQDVLILESDKWVPRFTSRSMPVWLWEFDVSGTMIQNIKGKRKDTLPFAFDPRAGYLTIYSKPMLVTRLTESQLVIRDWSEMTEGTVLQYFFTRM